MPKIKNMGHATAKFNEGVIVEGAGGDDVYALAVTGSISIKADLSNKYAMTIDNDQSSQGHVLKLLTDGNGSGSRVLEMEDGDGDIIFRARADGRFGFGPDGVDSMGAGTFVVGIDNSSHTSDIAISRRLQHLGDGDTYIDFPTNDQMQFQVGGVDMIHMTEDGTQDKIVFNDGAGDVDFIVKSPNESQAIYLNAANEVLHINHGESNFQTKIHNNNDLAITVNNTGVVFNDDSHADIDFRVESDSKTHMFFVDSGNNKIGIGTDSPTAAFHVNGSVAGKVTVVSSFPYSVAADDYIILVEGTGSPRAINLPAKSGQTGRILIIKDAVGNASSNNIEINPDGSENIDGSSDKLINTNRVALTIMCATDQWHIIAKYVD